MGSSRKRKSFEAAVSHVLLRARRGDTDGVYVRSEILSTVSPVLDGLLRDIATTGSGVDEVDDAVIILQCSAEELEAFVACISMTEGGSQDVSSGLADDDLSTSLLTQGARAMRCLDKYDASGVVRTLDLVAKCLLKATLPDAATLTLTEYFYARLATLPGDTHPEAVSESVCGFLAAQLAAGLESVKQRSDAVATCKQSHRSAVGGANASACAVCGADQRALRQAELALHAGVQTALVPKRVPPQVLAEILMRAMVPSWVRPPRPPRPASEEDDEGEDEKDEEDEEDEEADGEVI